jgi:hypothetical protein
MATQPISHALVLPDKDFMNWYKAAEPYTKAFERVAVVRSPAGNDLNRFRDITAVQAPGVWVQNNALNHIRRVYPMVVRVDVIQANTPAELSAALAQRINTRDRYGEKIAPPHISDRFILDWPSEARPARITRAFNHDLNGKKNEGIDVYAPKGTPIHAGAAGTVATVVRQQTALGYGQYVQIASNVSGVNYLTTYAFLQNIKVQMGSIVKAGNIIAEAGGDQTIKVVVQQPGGGLSGYHLPDVVDPTIMIYWQGIRLRTTATTLRIRERPGTSFAIIGGLKPFDRIETLEPHGRTLLKVEQPDQWIKIRSPQGIEGYAAAEYLIADEREGFKALNMTGMNLDILHPLGGPGADRMKGIGWVRFAYNVSMGRGSTDLDAAFRKYAPFIEVYARAGFNIILVMTHQTFGEGQGYVWDKMDTAQWRAFTAKYADVLRRIAGQYANRNWNIVYQIWNEQDTPPAIAHAAVPIPYADYAYLLAESIKAIRAVDGKSPIITGGHVGGPGNGANYARATINAMPASIRPDAIAVHSYGRGPVGSKYSPFGSIDEDVDAYSKIMPGAQIIITEWGVLDFPNDPPSQVADYAIGFISRLKNLYSGKVAGALWYAWADSMHNGYGLVDTRDNPKQPLYDRFLKA